MNITIDQISNINSNIQTWVDSSKGQIQEGITNLALAAITLPTNLNQDSLLEGFNTTYFINSISKITGEEPNKDGISATDLLLYHSLLYLFVNTAGHLIPANNGYIFSILSTPFFIKYAVSQPWFKEIKSECQSQLLKWGKKGAFNLCKNKAGKIKHEEVSAVKELIQADKSKLFKKFKDNLTDFVSEKKEILVDLSKEGFHAANSIYTTVQSSKSLSDLATLDNLDAAISYVENTQEKVHALKSMPEISLVKKPKEGTTSFISRTWTAWSMTSYVNPAFGPLYFTSNQPNLTEVIVRTAGAYEASTSGQYLQWIMLTELAVKVTKPLSLGRISFINRQIDSIKADFVESLRDDGFDRLAIDKICKISAEAMAIGLYTLSNSNSHPLMNAISCCSFIEYLGAIGDNMGVIESTSLTGEHSLARFPVQVATGLAFTILDMGVGSKFRPLTTLAVALITNPLVSDQIVESNLYQTKVMIPLSKMVPEEVKSMMRTARNSYHIFTFAKSYMPSLPSANNYVKTLLVAAPVVKFRNHPIVKSTASKTGQAASKVMSVYLQSTVSSVVGSYLGLAVGAATNISGKPMDLPTLGAVTAGMVVTVITQDTLMGTVTTELTNQVLRTSYAQPYLAKAFKLIDATTSYFKSKVNSLGLNPIFSGNGLMPLVARF